MEVKEIKKRAVKIIRDHLGDRAKIYLFGSWARGDAQPTSDIDIAFDAGSKIDISEFYQIKREIETIPTLRKIDVVDLKMSSKKFSNHILKYAVKL